MILRLLKSYMKYLAIGLIALTPSANLYASSLPKSIQDIMEQPKYSHAHWGLLVKDLNTNETLLKHNADQLFIIASVSKMFTTAALLNQSGPDFRFKTEALSHGVVVDKTLQGDLILKGAGDLVFGGRSADSETIAFTSLDHNNSNLIPGAILTPQDPLNGLKNIVVQLKERGIKEIDGQVQLDDSLFESLQMRDVMLSPFFINENIVDVTISPTVIDKLAQIQIRPSVGYYKIENEVVTLTSDEQTNIDIERLANHTIKIKGGISIKDQPLIRNFSINDPKEYTKTAMLHMLDKAGITVSNKQNQAQEVNELKALARFVSPPISEYVKLILKVSHNTGANLVPLLLSANQGGTTFDQGMLVLGNFLSSTVGLDPTSYSFLDAAGGDSNRATPMAVVKLLEYIYLDAKTLFKPFYHGLPILGTDGSLEDFGANSPAKGKVHAKTGTGVVSDLTKNAFLLTAISLGGYIEAKNGHTYAFMVVANNVAMDEIMDAMAAHEDVTNIATRIYEELSVDTTENSH